jgi:LCP family protein required for cell wall assembly
LIAILIKKRKKKAKKIILFTLGIILSIILIGVNVVIGFVYYKSNSFFNKITNIEYETSNYVTIVLKDSSFKKLEDVKSIGLFYNEIDKNYKEALSELNEKVKVNNNEYENILLLVTDVLAKKVDSIFINENYIEIIDEGTENFKDNIRILDRITISKETKQKKQEMVDIEKKNSFNIYISGIDTYGAITNVSRSDVNIIATVDMKNNKILLTNTPRDYYVQLHGTTGNKDKLTHAGVYGIDMSMQTLEDLYDTNIDYYVRVNFNSLIKMVDAIGGIDIYSDQTLYLGNCYIPYGNNHLDGKCALAFSRERHSYMEGDRHRGMNQQQVIEAIIKKVTESNDINNYLSLLNALEDSFQTNFDKKLINSFLNLQVKNNYKWSVESIQVNGYDDGGYTYSYPGQYLYVMQPDYNSLETAKSRIKEIIEANKSDN